MLYAINEGQLCLFFSAQLHTLSPGIHTTHTHTTHTHTQPGYLAVNELVLAGHTQAKLRRQFHNDKLQSVLAAQREVSHTPSHITHPH